MIGKRLAALALLVIIIAGISVLFGNKDPSINQRRLFFGIVKAADAGNGEIVLEKEILFKKESGFSTSTFGDEAGIPGKCIKFYAVDNSMVVLSSSGNNITFTEEKIFDVYYRCIRNLDGTSCPLDSCNLCCEINFGKKFPNQSP